MIWVRTLLALTLEGAGYEVIDLGVDVSPTQFVELLQNSIRKLSAFPLY